THPQLKLVDKLHLGDAVEDREVSQAVGCANLELNEEAEIGGELPGQERAHVHLVDQAVVQLQHDLVLRIVDGQVEPRAKACAEGELRHERLLGRGLCRGQLGRRLLVLGRRRRIDIGGAFGDLIWGRSGHRLDGRGGRRGLDGSSDLTRGGLRDRGRGGRRGGGRLSDGGRRGGVCLAGRRFGLRLNGPGQKQRSRERGGGAVRAGTDSDDWIKVHT